MCLTLGKGWHLNEKRATLLLGKVSFLHFIYFYTSTMRREKKQAGECESFMEGTREEKGLMKFCSDNCISFSVSIITTFTVDIREATSSIFYNTMAFSGILVKRNKQNKNPIKRIHS